MRAVANASTYIDGAYERLHYYRDRAVVWNAG